MFLNVITITLLQLIYELNSINILNEFKSDSKAVKPNHVLDFPVIYKVEVNRLDEIS